MLCQRLVLALLWIFFFTSGDHASKSSSIVLGMCFMHWMLNHFIKRFHNFQTTEQCMKRWSTVSIYSLQKGHIDLSLNAKDVYSVEVSCTVPMEDLFFMDILRPEIEAHRLVTPSSVYFRLSFTWFERTRWQQFSENRSNLHKT